jgi:hypothetical protein
MELLLAAKADAEAITYHGWTPLILSAMNKYTEACETLRDHSVDERGKCREGKTAKDYAPEMFCDCCSTGGDIWDEEVDHYETDYYGHYGYA